MRRTARDLARTLANAEPREVVRLAKTLIKNGDRHLAYELLQAHDAAMGSLGARDVETLGRGIEDSGGVDQFACFVAGQAWRRGRIADSVVLRWARSDDRLWRRAAVVSTVPLNARSRGGGGDTRRTLAVCRAVMEDTDDLVVNALSWALRELSKQDVHAVERFLVRHAERVPALVHREVRSRISTGRKSGVRRHGRR